LGITEESFGNSSGEIFFGSVPFGSSKRNELDAAETALLSLDFKHQNINQLQSFDYKNQLIG
jgi:hypothetical protein